MWAAPQQDRPNVRTGPRANEAAIQLYEKCGFMPAGSAEPLRSDPQLTTLEYLLALA
jgi:ribosomal protein S18 acetylase RimI-like enzyme